LNKNLIIKKIVAAVLLCVFTLSIAPTIILHNALATHTDSVKKLPSDHQQQVEKHLFNCHCDHLVAESLFTEPAIFVLQNCLPVYSLNKVHHNVHFVSFSHFFYSLRGPPVV